ncbi:hypothetical protein V5799_006129 [Amblyomma americanum]|uniref:Uncharacterized protein n=1 Tax=Amblyomma americanum TaxID=6943 RepID=A0AAQ4DX99_AMBAM
MGEPVRPRRAEGQKPRGRSFSEPARSFPSDKSRQSWTWESPDGKDWKSSSGGAERWSRSSSSPYENQESIESSSDISKDEELSSAVKAGMLGFILVMCLVVTIFLMNLPRPPVARDTATPEANLSTVESIPGASKTPVIVDDGNQSPEPPGRTALPHGG